MKILLKLTAGGLIKALRWRRQDMLVTKPPKIAPRPIKPRGAGASAVTLMDIERLFPRRKPRLTKVQRRARMRVAERLAKASE